MQYPHSTLLYTVRSTSPSPSWLYASIESASCLECKQYLVTCKQFSVFGWVNQTTCQYRYGLCFGWLSGPISIINSHAYCVLNCCVQLRKLKRYYNPVQLRKVNGNYNSGKHRQDGEEGQQEKEERKEKIKLKKVRFIFIFTLFFRISASSSPRGSSTDHKGVFFALFAFVREVSVQLLWAVFSSFRIFQYIFNGLKRWFLSSDLQWISS